VKAVKISQTNAVIGLTLAVLAIILYLQSPPAGEDRGTTEAQYTDAWITSPDPLLLGVSLGETGVIGRISSAKLPVTVTMWDASKPNPDTWRGFSNVTVIERQVDHVNVVLLDEEYNPIQYPVTWSPRNFYGDLQYLMDSLYVQVRGELFNYTGWDGELYQMLKLTGVSLYSVKFDPAPLSHFQIGFTTDMRYYHTNNTAMLSITNLSEDWIHFGRNIELYKVENGSLINAQEFPDNYVVTDELRKLFPGNTWSQPLPLYHLEPGEYTIVKEVNHYQSPKVRMKANITIVEDFVSKANATHRYALRALNCTLPEVPERLPIPRVVHIPITVEEAEEIAVNVFGFQEPIDVEGSRRIRIRSQGRELEFMTRYDLLYFGDYGTFNVWNETRVVHLAEELISKLEEYWVDSTPLNYSVRGVGPSMRTDGTVLEVGVGYRLSLDGVPLEGPGADFGVGVSNYEISGCEIHRPVLTIEGYEYVKTSPVEAVQRMLRGESDTHALGFDILGARPLGSEVTITKVSLTYYTDLPLPSGLDWLVQVYVIEGVFHVDPAIFEEETIEFREYILATGFPYERTILEGSDLAGLSVRVETDKTLYELGETVLAEVRLVNNRGIPVHVNVSQPISLNGFSAGKTTAMSHPVTLDYVDLGNHSSLSLGVYAFEPEAGGLYVLEFAGNYGSVFVSDGAHRAGFNISVRKLTLRTGETVAFNVECVEPLNGSYVVVWDSHGEQVWTSNPFDKWLRIDDRWVLPFYQQTADGDPMVISGGDPLGLWGYTWYMESGEKITDGYFNVAWMISQGLFTGPSDLGLEDEP
jgi:hypothetical protein